jgi:hypothetical protein
MSEKIAQAIVTTATALIRRAGRQGIDRDAFERQMRQRFVNQPRVLRTFTGDSLATLFTAMATAENVVRGMNGQLCWHETCEDGTPDGRMRNNVSRQIDDVYLVFDCMREFQRLNGSFTTQQIIRTLSHRTGMPLATASRTVGLTFDQFGSMLVKLDNDQFQFSDITPSDRAATMALFHRLVDR